MRPSVWLCGPFCLIAVGIVAYDAYTLVTGGRKDATENTLNLALDVVPFGKLRYAHELPAAAEEAANEGIYVIRGARGT